MAQAMATSGFDPALPLWEAVLVEGVDGDRAALVMKVHHALIDGVGGLAVLAQLFDSPDAERPRVPSSAARRRRAASQRHWCPVRGTCPTRSASSTARSTR